MQENNIYLSPAPHFSQKKKIMANYVVSDNFTFA